MNKLALGRFTLLGFLTSFSVAYAAPYATGPAALFDDALFGQQLEKFSSQADSKAFRDFIEIIYDRSIGRPWGEAYFPEVSHRLQAIRSFICPASEEKCLLPNSKITDQKGLEALVSLINTDDVQAPLQSYFLRSRDTFYYSHFIRTPWILKTPDVNVFMSAHETKNTMPGISFWEMPQVELSEYLQEFIVIQDLPGYSASYEGSRSPGYFALTGKNGVFINTDRIKKQAQGFGFIWKFSVEKSDALGNDFDTLALQRIARDHQVEFEAKYQELLRRLNEAKQDAQIESDLQRFWNEKVRGKYPEEVYQHVAYGIFLKLIQAQARYFSLAQNHRAGLYLKRQIWESVLTQQAYADPIAALYFTYSEAGVPLGWILDQFVKPSVAPAVLFEELKAVLGIREFEGKGLFPSLRYAVASDELFDKNTVEEMAPELAQELTDPRSHQLRKLESFGDEQLRKFLSRYLIDPQGRIRTRSLYQLSALLIGRIKSSDSARLAEHIHSVRHAVFEAKK